MVTVLHTGCKLCKNGGIENYIMNLYRQIDRNKVKFIFLVDREQESDNFIDEIEALGGEIVFFDGNAPFFSLILEKYRLFKKMKYDIAHIHVSCGIRAIDGVISKIANLKSKIFFHSHSNIGKRPLKYTVLIPVYRMLGNRLFACSAAAGRYFFGNGVEKNSKFKVTANAIDTSKFVYDDCARKRIRKEFSVEDSQVLLGYVGRLSEEKNIKYILDVSKALKEKGVHLKTLIVGDGPERTELIRYAENLSIIDNVVFTGNREDIPHLMSAMDLFMLSSFHEGLGIVLIEAQATGLPCFASSRVPKETKISSLINYFDIEKVPSVTADKMFDFLANNYPKRAESLKAVNLGEYDVKISSKKMTDYYIQA